MNKILIVDDEPNNLQALRRLFFERQGFACEFADHGATALEMVETFAPDVVILDILMPGLDGYAVCRRIKSNPSSATTMVLLLSGLATLDARIKGYAAQADDYIVKPYDPEELLAKVNVLLRLKKAQDELREMNRNLESLVQQRTRELLVKEKQAVIGQMIQGIVHNFNGPLTGTKGFAQLAKERLEYCLAKGRGAEKELEGHLKEIDYYLGYILTASKQLAKLVNDLLVKSRKDSSPQKVHLDINEVIAQEITFLEADMTLKHKVSKEFDLASSVPRFWGVYSDFSQIIYNLIRNAVDAMSASPEKRLTIRSSFDDGQILVEVCDTGTGIEPAIAEKIFEPFFSTKRLAGETKEGEPAGSGLGLYTCSEIIKAYDGRISVQSEPGKGACFSIHIPCPPPF